MIAVYTTGRQTGTGFHATLVCHCRDDAPSGRKQGKRAITRMKEGDVQFLRSAGAQ
jgi:hypothetical protein